MDSLKSYRDNLQPGDLTLLGLVTEGGQGLATGNNGEFIGCLEGTNEAIRIKQTRPSKLKTTFENNKNLYRAFPIFKNCKNKNDYENILNSLDEQTIRSIFSKIKKKINRDIFGQGYLYRIVSNDEITSIEKISKKEIVEGIINKKAYVVYDKGDKSGNRWFLKSPYYILWNQESLNIFKTDKKARWQGYNYFFRKGFCWSDIHTTYLKSRLSNNGPYDVKSMTLFSLLNKLPDYYLISILNSKLIAEFQQEFLNNTASFQINDARKIPVVVPDEKNLTFIKNLFDDFINLKKSEYLESSDFQDRYLILQKKLDNEIYNLYGV